MPKLANQNFVAYRCFNGLFPTDLPKSLTIDLDFTQNLSYDIELEVVEQTGRLPFVQGVFIDNSKNVAAAPGAPVTGTTAGGTLAATTYFVRTTLVNAQGETLASSEVSQAALINTLLTVNSPVAASGATAYRIYAGQATGSETLQATVPIGTNWTEPTTGLITGVPVPVTATAGNPLTLVAFPNAHRIIVPGGKQAFCPIFAESSKFSVSVPFIASTSDVHLLFTNFPMPIGQIG